jgi:hypothetical protein
VTKRFVEKVPARVLPFALVDIDGVAPTGKHCSLMNVLSNPGSNKALNGTANRYLVVPVLVVSLVVDRVEHEKHY